MNCKLSNMPIGKNLLFVAMQLQKAIKNNDKLILNDNYRCSIYETVGCENGNWYPWLWSRVESNTENKNWNLYFDEWNYPIKSDNELYFLADCCRAVFSPKQYITEKNTFLNTNKKIIGIHVRRGDAKYFLNNSNFKKVVDVELYASIIKNYCPKEYAIYCASDSIDDVFLELKKFLPNYDIFYSSLSKNVPEVPQGYDIEIFISKNLKYVEQTVVSALIDIQNLSKSDVFIGPIHDSVYSSFASLLSLSYKKDLFKFYDIVNLENKNFNLNRIYDIGIRL